MLENVKNAIITGNYKVLITDDSQVNRFVVTKNIEKIPNHTFKIYEASNGIEAIELTKEHKFDIIFMDIKMKPMNGLEATKIIKQIYPDSIVIGITGLDIHDEQKDKIKECGIVDYIIKPIKREKLLEIINKYIEIKTIKLND